MRTYLVRLVGLPTIFVEAYYCGLRPTTQQLEYRCTATNSAYTGGCKFEAGPFAVMLVCEVRDTETREIS